MMRLTWGVVFTTLTLMPLLPTSGLAQVRSGERAFPWAEEPAGDRARARTDLVAFLNDPGTLRILGGGRIPEGVTLVGPVAIVGGSLVLGGRIEGPLVVVNGDLRLLPSARVTGDVTVVGGVVAGGGDGGWLSGTLHLEPAPLRYRIRGDRIELEPGAPELPPFLVREAGPFEFRPLLRSTGAYNRVEGLPVLAGLSLETRSRNPLQVEGGVIWRSAAGLEVGDEALGYHATVVQDVGGRNEARIAWSTYRDVRPIERRGMSDTESSLSTFFLRRDLRDHFEREGWSVWLEGSPLDLPLRFRVDYREEDHAPARPREPWTLGSGDRPWRPQPLVAEGSVRLLSFHVDVDTRDDPISPSTGWWIETGLHRQVGGSPRLPPEAGEASNAPFELATRGHLDLRRYNRLTPTTRLQGRLLLSGSLGEVALPPQFQRTLGGEGSLPGHPRFAVDCGARGGVVPAPMREARGGATTESTGGDPFLEAFPAYGCDGIGLVQLELQGRLPWAWRPDDSDGSWEMAALLDLRPAFTVFVDGGWGWTHADPDLGDVRLDAPFRADAGVGFHVGPLGVYWAAPLNRRDRGVNFFVRLSQRF